MITKKRKKTKRTKSSAMKFLDSVAGTEFNFATMLRSIREADEISQIEFANLLGISRQNLCDIEKKRKGVSPERAASFARTLGYPETVFVTLALQDEVDRGGLRLRVSVEVASKSASA